MIKQWLEIRVSAYLKTPSCGWTVKNSVQGSFSNSGSYRSLSKCALAYFTGADKRNDLRNMKVYVVVVHGFDELEQPVTSTTETYLNKLLPPEYR